MNPALNFVYVATGERYRHEAAESVRQLRQWHPAARVCLVTDQAGGPVFWDDLVVLEKPAFGFRDKIAMRRCPYDRFVFLDTDANVVGDLSDIFALLERFDLAGHQLFEGHDCPLPGLPDAFPEFNTGVLGFRRSPAVEKLFDQWEAHYDRFFAQNRDGYYHYSNVSDQKSLRLAVYESALSVAVLGPEFNFVPHHVNFACGAVRILHGRGAAHLAELRTRLNARLGNRVYVPRLDAVVSDLSPARELRRLWWMTTLQIIRLAGVSLTPLRFRDWLRASPLIRRLFLRNRFTESTPARDPKWRQPS